MIFIFKKIRYNRSRPNRFFKEFVNKWVVIKVGTDTGYTVHILLLVSCYVNLDPELLVPDHAKIKFSTYLCFICT